MSLYGLTKESILRCVIIVSISKAFLVLFTTEAVLYININGGFRPFSGTGLLVAVTLLIK